MHDCKAPAHTSMLLPKILAKNKTLIMAQSPYSPVLAPADIFLFPNLKTPMKEMSFTTIEEIKEKSKQKLLPIIIFFWSRHKKQIVYIKWIVCSRENFDYKKVVNTL